MTRCVCGHNKPLHGNGCGAPDCDCKQFVRKSESTDEYVRILRERAIKTRQIHNVTINPIKWWILFYANYKKLPEGADKRKKRQGRRNQGKPRVFWHKDYDGMTVNFFKEGYANGSIYNPAFQKQLPSLGFFNVRITNQHATARYSITESLSSRPTAQAILENLGERGYTARPSPKSKAVILHFPNDKGKFQLRKHSVFVSKCKHEEVGIRLKIVEKILAKYGKWI